MSKINFLIRWDAEFKPKNAPIALARTLNNIDAGIFKDTTFVTDLWKTVAKKIGKIVDRRFIAQGPGWTPLKPKYLSWKKRMVSQGKRIKVGSFSKRKIKFIKMGQLTGTLRRSATKKKKDANIFEVGNTPGWIGGALTYAIDLKKLPYAKFFNDKRRFFFLEESESQEVMKAAQKKIRARMRELSRK